MKKTIIVIMLLTILVKFSGFLRDLVLSYFYGASFVSDAYLISLTIPSLIFAFISVSLTTAFIPTYTLINEEKGKKIGIQFTNKLASFFIITSTILVVFTLIFTREVVKIFASGFDGEVLDLAIFFTKITILGIYFSTLMAIFRGYLQVKNNFTITSLIALPYNLIILISIYLSSKYNNLSLLAIGTLIGAFSQMAIMIPSLIKEGYKFNFNFKFNDKYIKKFSIIAFPVILGVSINEINSLVDRTIASRLVEGAISALNYSFSLTQFVNGTFAAAIAIAMYPMISKMVVDNNLKGLNSSITESLNLISILVLPITGLTMVFSEDIITLLYGRGAFNTEAILLTSKALFYYAIGMLAYGYREVLSRAFYATQDSITPMVSAAFSMIINIALNIILSKYMGIAGLALATSISGILGSLLLVYNYNKKIASFKMNIIAVTLKIIIASLIMSTSAFFLNNLFYNILNPILSLIISLSMAFVIYFLLLYILNIKEISNLKELVSKKFNSMK